MQIPRRKSDENERIIFDPIMSKDKFCELQNKIEKLKKSQPQAREEVSRLAQLGDFSENAEYQLAKGRLRGINNAILRLENQIHQAVVIEPQKKNSVVQIGNSVLVNFNNKEKTFIILGSSESDPQKGIISYSSPLGKLLLGKKVNDVVFLELKNKKIEYKILKIK